MDVPCCGRYSASSPVPARRCRHSQAPVSRNPRVKNPSRQWGIPLGRLPRGNRPLLSQPSIQLHRARSGIEPETRKKSRFFIDIRTSSRHGRDKYPFLAILGCRSAVKRTNSGQGLGRATYPISASFGLRLKTEPGGAGGVLRHPPHRLRLTDSGINHVNAQQGAPARIEGTSSPPA